MAFLSHEPLRRASGILKPLRTDRQRYVEYDDFLLRVHASRQDGYDDASFDDDGQGR